MVGVGVCVTGVVVIVGVIVGVVVGLGIGDKQQDLNVIIVKFLVGVGVIVGVTVGVTVEVGQGCVVPVPKQSLKHASQLKPYPPFTYVIVGAVLIGLPNS